MKTKALFAIATISFALDHKPQTGQIGAAPITTDLPMRAAFLPSSARPKTLNGQPVFQGLLLALQYLGRQSFCQFCWKRGRFTSCALPRQKERKDSGGTRLAVVTNLAMVTDKVGDLTVVQTTHPPPLSQMAIQLCFSTEMVIW